MQGAQYRQTIFPKHPCGTMFVYCSHPLGPHRYDIVDSTWVYCLCHVAAVVMLMDSEIVDGPPVATLENSKPGSWDEPRPMPHA